MVGTGVQLLQLVYIDGTNIELGAAACGQQPDRHPRQEGRGAAHGHGGYLRILQLGKACFSAATARGVVLVS